MGFFFRPTVKSVSGIFFTFLLCIIIEFVAADFYNNSCCHVQCLLITEGCQ